jgi:hypothetical protein
MPSFSRDPDAPEPNAPRPVGVVTLIEPIRDAYLAEPGGLVVE